MTPLHCLGGREAPHGIAADLCVLARLSDRARAHFWDALGPSLAEPLPASIEATLHDFMTAFDVREADLARAIKASRFLVREACARGVDAAHFEDDLVRLAGGPRSPEAAVVAPILLLGYGAARSAMRAAMVESTISDHGASLVSIEWRVDSILSSSRGDALDAKTAILTLGYKRGSHEERLTLHVSAPKLEELRLACERMLA